MRGAIDHLSLSSSPCPDTIGTSFTVSPGQNETQGLGLSNSGRNFLGTEYLIYYKQNPGFFF